eukprot:1193302-Prorocentrum_minimum.AAC.1
MVLALSPQPELQLVEVPSAGSMHKSESMLSLLRQDRWSTASSNKRLIVMANPDPEKNGVRTIMPWRDFLGTPSTPPPHPVLDFCAPHVPYNTP